MSIGKSLAVSVAVCLTSTIALGQLSISNPNNPFDAKGYALRQHVMATNAKFKTIPCTDPAECWSAWSESLGNAYHGDPSAYAIVNDKNIDWKQREIALMVKISAALGTGQSSGTLSQLTTIENEIATSYPNKTAAEAENQMCLFLIATNLKHMIYALNVDGVSAGPDSGVPSGFPSEAQIDACMRRAINSATIFDIILDHGAGPGGWVIDNYLTCLIR